MQSDNSPGRGHIASPQSSGRRIVDHEIHRIRRDLVEQTLRREELIARHRVQCADARLARLQRDGAQDDTIREARDERDAAVRAAVTADALRRLDEGIEGCVDEGDGQ